MSELFIGTCSWADRSLIASNEFYPRDANTPEKRLAFYASKFRSVEVDSTFYALPSERNSLLWLKRTPEGFIFNFKAYGAMTGHGVSPASLPVDLRIDSGDSDKRVFIKDAGVIKEIFNRFISAISPVVSAGKLGVVLFQYPPWFEKTYRNLDEILKAKEMMRGIECAVEFRNRSWLDDKNAVDTLRFLRENRLTYVISDAPQVRSQKTTRYLVDSTTDIAYFRFHGRNVENWDKKGVDLSLRYDYEYSEEELRRFAEDIRLIKGKVKKVFAMFNNHRGSQAVRNALDLIRILSEE